MWTQLHILGIVFLAQSLSLCNGEIDGTFLDAVQKLADVYTETHQPHIPENDWSMSPFALVNAIPVTPHFILNEDYKNILEMGYHKAFKFLESKPEWLDRHADVVLKIGATIPNSYSRQQARKLFKVSLSDTTDLPEKQDAEITTGLSVRGDWDKAYFHDFYSTVDKFYFEHSISSQRQYVETMFMQTIDYFKWVNLTDLDSTGLAIPLKQSPNLLCIFILPNTLEDYEFYDTVRTSNTFHHSLNDIITQFKTAEMQRVRVKLPVMEFETQLHFNISGLEERYSEITHETSMRIDERGIKDLYVHGLFDRRPYTVDTPFPLLEERDDDKIFEADSSFELLIVDTENLGYLSYSNVKIPAQVKKGWRPVLNPLNGTKDYSRVEGLPKSEEEKFKLQTDRVGRKLYALNRNVLRKENNFVVTPFGVETAFSALAEGADEESLKNIETFGEFKSGNYKEKLKSALSKIQGGENVELTNETSLLYTSDSLVYVDSEFQSEVKREYGVEVKTEIDDFTNFFSLTAKSDLLLNAYLTTEKLEKRQNPPRSKDDLKLYRTSWKGTNLDGEESTIPVMFLERNISYLNLSMWNALAYSIPLSQEASQNLIILIPEESSNLFTLEETILSSNINLSFITKYMEPIVQFPLALPILNLQETSKISFADKTQRNSDNLLALPLNLPSVNHNATLNAVNVVSTFEFNLQPKSWKSKNLTVCNFDANNLPYYPEHQDIKFKKNFTNERQREYEVFRRKHIVNRPFLYYIENGAAGILAMGRFSSFKKC